MIKIIKRIGRRIGATKDYQSRLSDIITESGEIIDKKHTQETSIDNTGFLGNYVKVPEKYEVTIRGKESQFTVDDENLFNEFNVGDKGRLSYRKATVVTYDFVPPNFEKKVKVKEHSPQSPHDKEFVEFSVK